MTELLPYKDASLPVEKRVSDLLGRMTLEEKIAQLVQIFIFPGNRDAMVDLIRKNGVGSRILSTTHLAGSIREKAATLDEANDLQRVAVEETRLGIPILYGRDIIHGHRTVFPVPLALAASWNPELIEAAYGVAAKEAASAGVHWAFSPMLDIARDPRWGRVIEGFGEDPYLASQMAPAAVRGFQGEDTRLPEHILACAKHYLGYGGAEGGRDYNSAEISDNTLRNVYLPPFRAAVEAGVGSIMSAFLDFNGEPVSGSHYLLTEILKEQLGFSGLVVSDWDSVAELINHRVAADGAQAAEIAFNAGVDMEMVSGCYRENMADLVRAGKVSQERLDDAVCRVLTAKFRLGLFEQPYNDPELAEKVQFCAEHKALARKAACQSMVLLQNNGGLLPLDRSELKQIAVIGPLAKQRAALLGSWTLDGVPEETQNLLEAVQAACPDCSVPDVSDALSDEMLMAAAEADLVILAVGESHRRNGEYNNVASIDLPAGQLELIEAVHGLGKPVVLVVLAGRPVALTQAVPFVDAILYGWHPGSLGASAAADILFGEVAPSGKLPVSFPRTEGQIPVYYNHKSTGRPTMSRYHDMPVEPLYPFGYGLSYTTFAYRDIQIDRAEIGPDESVVVSAEVRNSGERAGVEVVQCYIQDCVSSLTRPVRELKGFARVALEAGETRRVEFTLGFKELAFYVRDGSFRLEPGDFKVWIGGSSLADLETGFKVKPA
jgi:beta-glucosidase